MPPPPPPHSATLCNSTPQDITSPSTMALCALAANGARGRLMLTNNLSQPYSVERATALRRLVHPPHLPTSAAILRQRRAMTPTEFFAPQETESCRDTISKEAPSHTGPRTSHTSRAGRFQAHTHGRAVGTNALPADRRVSAASCLAMLG